MEENKYREERLRQVHRVERNEARKAHNSFF